MSDARQLPCSSAGRVSSSVRDALRKYRGLGGSHNRTLFLRVLEARNSRIKVPQGRVHSEVASLGSYHLTVLCVSGQRKGEGRQRESSLVCFLIRTRTLMTIFNRNHLRKGRISKYSYSAFRASTYGFGWVGGRHRHSVDNEEGRRCYGAQGQDQLVLGRTLEGLSSKS